MKIEIVESSLEAYLVVTNVARPGSSRLLIKLLWNIAVINTLSAKNSAPLGITWKDFATEGHLEEDSCRNHRSPVRILGIKECLSITEFSLLILSLQISYLMQVFVLNNSDLSDGAVFLGTFDSSIIAYSELIDCPIRALLVRKFATPIIRILPGFNRPNHILICWSIALAADDHIVVFLHLDLVFGWDIKPASTNSVGITLTLFK